jgi:hypothetical protein
MVGSVDFEIQLRERKYVKHRDTDSSKLVLLVKSPQQPQESFTGVQQVVT